jgi:hypothetical protein
MSMIKHFVLHGSFEQYGGTSRQPYFLPAIFPSARCGNQLIVATLPLKHPNIEFVSAQTLSPVIHRTLWMLECGRLCNILPHQTNFTLCYDNLLNFTTL